MEKLKQKKQKETKDRTVQARITGSEVGALETCKSYFGFKTDAALTRFLIVRTADNIKTGRPLSIIQQAQS